MPITKEELYFAIEAMAKSKALGPNGGTSGIFLLYVADHK